MRPKLTTDSYHARLLAASAFREIVDSTLKRHSLLKTTLGVSQQVASFYYTGRASLEGYIHAFVKLGMDATISISKPKKGRKAAINIVLTGDK